jgi:hypothetical protein
VPVSPDDAGARSSSSGDQGSKSIFWEKRRGSSRDEGRNVDGNEIYRGQVGVADLPIGFAAAAGAVDHVELLPPTFRSVEKSSFHSSLVPPVH